MSVYVFVGPTLAVEDARTELDAIYLPPVSQGDVYRVARRGARAIGIVDGYFERVPAVWHKEILWAMSEGVHVFGSASMGALRAAELAAFGMEGVGAIFEAYRDGVLEDDDEVAVAHGPAESGYRALSEAMINIRRALAEAHALGLIGASTRDGLTRIAKELYYPERSYPTILRLAAAQGYPAAELEATREWLPQRGDQKREDALEMLRAMRVHLAGDPRPKRVRYTFERTIWWESARLAAGDVHLDGDGAADAVLLGALLDEARLDGDTYHRASDAALLRYLAAREVGREGAAVSAESRQETLDELRRERGLLRPEDVERWLAENDLTRERLGELVDEEAALASAASDARAEVLRRLPDQLRLLGRYRDLLERARDKQRRLATRGWDNPGLDDVGLTRAELLRWYVGRRGRPVEHDVARHAREAGFADEESFTRAILRELCYERCLRGDDDTAAASS